MADDRISVAFDLPLETPLDPTGDVVLRLYDPTYFYAYDLVALEEGTGARCRAKIVPFEPDTAAAELQQKLAALSREETPEQENVGQLFSDQVWLLCD